VTFRRLHPAAECYPDPLRATCGARTLPRFRAPTAPPFHRGQPLPGYPRPGSRHAHAPFISGAPALHSLGGLPGILSTRRAHGVRILQSLTSQRSPEPLDSRIPSRDWRTRRLTNGNRAVTPSLTARRASPQGFHPSAGWDRRRWISPSLGRPWLSWVSSFLGHSPSRASNLGGQPAPLHQDRQPTPLPRSLAPCSTSGLAAIGSPLGTSGESR